MSVSALMNTVRMYGRGSEVNYCSTPLVRLSPSTLNHPLASSLRCDINTHESDMLSATHHLLKLFMEEPFIFYLFIFMAADTARANMPY